MTKAMVLLAGLAAVWGANAQVTVEILMEQQQFLRGEAIPVGVRVVNRSGQTLKLGAETNWLTFSMESKEGRVVSPSTEPPVQGEFELPSSRMGTKRLDLAPYFVITEPGRYALTATVQVPQWGAQVSSGPKSFDVTEGAKLWEQEFGLPSTSGFPTLRRYTLLQANYVRGQLKLFLRVSESSGAVLKLQMIGTMLSFSRPEAQVDPQGLLHVFYQDRPHSFSYTVYNPEGELLQRQTFDYLNARPRLQMDREGKIRVFGGERRVTHSDFPPPPKESASALSDTNAPPAPGTSAPAESAQPKK